MAKAERGACELLQLPDLLILSCLEDIICTLLSISACRLADSLVEEGGLELLLSLPRTQQTCTSLSLVQVGITLIPSAFQRAAALPKETVSQFVGAVLDHLRSSSDLARKNASVFFGNALVQPAILEVFDEADGLKMLLTAIKASRLVLKQAAGQEPPRQEKQVQMQPFNPRQFTLRPITSVFSTSPIRAAPTADSLYKPVHQILELDMRLPVDQMK